METGGRLHVFQRPTRSVRCLLVLAALIVICWAGSLVLGTTVFSGSKGLTWAFILQDGYISGFLVPVDYYPRPIQAGRPEWFRTSPKTFGFGLAAWGGGGPTCSSWTGLAAFAMPLYIPLLTLLLIGGFLHRRLLRIRAATCVTCEYDLTGNVTGTCPECGTPISEEVRKTLAAKEANAKTVS